jgi:hypothetical protein
VSHVHRLTQLAESNQKIFVFQDVFVSKEDTLNAHGIPHLFVSTVNELPCEGNVLTFATLFSTADCITDIPP